MDQDAALRVSQRYAQDRSKTAAFAERLNDYFKHILGADLDPAKKAAMLVDEEAKMVRKYTDAIRALKAIQSSLKEAVGFLPEATLPDLILEAVWSMGQKEATKDLRSAEAGFQGVLQKAARLATMTEQWFTSTILSLDPTKSHILFPWPEP